MPDSHARRGKAASGPATPEIFIPVNNPIEVDHGRLKARLRPMQLVARLARKRQAVRLPALVW
jgi:hypothetical protein